MPLNFYELYNLINENTVSQEIKSLKKNIPSLSEDIIEAKKELKAAFLHLDIADKSLEALAKWMMFLLTKSNWNRISDLTHVVIKLKNDFNDFLAHSLAPDKNFNVNLLNKFNNPLFTYQDLTALSDQYHQELKSGKLRIPGREGKIVLDFPDGYKWVDIEKGSCDVEAKSMGHCGNSGARKGDTILSLRDSKNFPHLTFILNNGILEERKGRANTKPKEKYHPYILKLLELPMIKDLGKGRYLPENDFQLFDLKQEKLDEILKIKPEFEKSLLLNYFSNFIKSQKFNSRSDMIEKVKSLEDSFPTQIKKELLLVLKYAYEHDPAKNNIDKVFTENEMIEILNNEKIMNLDNLYATTMGERLDIFERIAFETKSEKVQKETLKIAMQNKSSKIIEGLLNNHNISQEVSIKIPELLEKNFLYGDAKNLSILSDPRMPEKVLRMVVNSQRYNGELRGMGFNLDNSDKDMSFKDEQTNRLYYVAKNPNCPSDLLDKLSKDDDDFVIGAVIHNKNTKIESLKNILKNLEAVPPVYRWLPSDAKRIHDQIHDILKRVDTSSDLRR